ncbi:hypothetical protein [Phytomonospora endophytica]|uniref:Uncharacterized protein n=1 Tax=Phytomonospora endophytica TaxID=714109 RepID=A0A841FI43_9ACTN|nr:hypothetical protein [Phytomonospora endophytica]MBB6032787.1 hypothetical protein [Phytomonospora endophytica]GIG66064.1 hypothetical protein Pen01_23590 [Phytomonospora endophytica]
MTSALPILLLGLGGLLGGGAYSVHKQGGSKFAIVILVLVALVAVGGGVLWMLPDGGK